MPEKNKAYFRSTIILFQMIA